MRIGYGRVSTRDQNPDGQHEALEAAGCERVFIDHARGTLASRPELDDALMVARPGDELVVTKLDRLGRSLDHLMDLAADFQDREVHLVVLDQGIDTSTAVGRMFFHILGAIAEFSVIWTGAAGQVQIIEAQLTRDAPTPAWRPPARAAASAGDPPP